MPRFDEEEEKPWEEEDEDPIAEDEDDDLGDDEEEEEEEVDDELLELIQQSADFCEVGEHRKALRLWRKSMDRYSDEPIAYLHLAATIFSLIEEELGGGVWDSTAEVAVYHQEAVTALDEALVMDPELVDAWNLLGALHMMREDHEEAVKAWTKSLELDEDQDEVRQDLEEAKGFLD